MKALSAIGHFAFGKECLDGQTVKTNIVTDELAKILGNENVVKKCSGKWGKSQNPRKD